jgi:hypothetical protein
MAGARNGSVAIGEGRLHFFDQPREDGGRGTIHPIGIQADNLESLVTRTKTKGLPFRKEIRNFELWKWAMTPAPTNVR